MSLFIPLKRVEKSKYEVAFYKAKVAALDCFYSYIDDGDDYELAMVRYFYDIHPSNEIENIIMTLTLAARHYRCGRKLPECMVSKLEEAIRAYEKFSIKLCQLDDNERQELGLDYKEAQLALAL